IQDAGNAQRKLANPVHCGLYQRVLPAQETLLSDRGQTLSVKMRAPGTRHHSVVAGHLAVKGKLALNPPYARVKEQQRLHQLLRQIAPIISSLEMGQFMQDYVLQFVRSQV